MKIAPKTYDDLEMLLAFHVSEKARARQEQRIMQVPEHLREIQKQRYTLEQAVKEVLSEVAEVALLIKELECSRSTSEHF